MLYILPEENPTFTGGAGEDTPERRAEILKTGLADDAETRAEYFERALPQSGKNPEELLKIAQRLLIEDAREPLGEKLAKAVAKTLTLKHVVEFFKAKNAKQAERQMDDAREQSMRKEAIIDSAFHVEKGSLNATLSRARLFDKSITLDDVRNWRLENANMERRPSKFNTWVGNRARDEYQVDLFFFEDLKPREQGEKLREEFNAGLLMVDTFSKKLAVVPIPDKTQTTLQKALLEGFREMGGKPGMIYTDAEGALTSREMQEWLSHQRIAHSITMTHAPLAERMIGFIKGRIIRHLQPGQKWWQVVEEVVKRYNSEHKSRSHKMTPNQASMGKNRLEVKTNLEALRRNDNPQPRLDPGDRVRVMVKKKFEKGYAPNWSDKTYAVAQRVPGNHAPLGDVVDPQVQYKLTDPTGTLPGYKNKFMRHELLLTKKQG